MSFFLFKRKPSLSLVFDIRDSFISACAVRFEKNKKPEMVLCTRTAIKQFDRSQHKKYFGEMIKSVDHSIMSIRKGLAELNNSEEVGTYYFFIGSPWSASQAKTIKISKDRPFEINDEVLAKIFAGEEEGILHEIEKETEMPDWRILEEKIIQSKLNGYKINEIFGKRTTNLAIELFVSYVPTELKDKIDNYFEKRQGGHINTQNHSCIMSSYSFFRDLYTNKNDFIYVDIGNLITDIYVVRDDVIFGIASIPFGEENIIQTSISKTNLTRDVFMSHISIGHDKKFELQSHNKGADLLRIGFDMWQTKLKYTLSKICTEMNIPNNLFMVTNSVVSNILAKDISEKEGGKPLQLLGTKIDLSIIGEGIINSFISNAKSYPNNPYVKMDVIFLNKMLNK